jgi:hypothetical protein
MTTTHKPPFAGAQAVHEDGVVTGWRCDRCSELHPLEGKSAPLRESAPAAGTRPRPFREDTPAPQPARRWGRTEAKAEFDASVRELERQVSTPRAWVETVRRMPDVAEAAGVTGDQVATVIRNHFAGPGHHGANCSCQTCTALPF